MTVRKNLSPSLLEGRGTNNSFRPPSTLEFFSLNAKRIGMRSAPGHGAAPILYHELVAHGVPGAVAVGGHLHLVGAYAMRANGEFVRHIPHAHTQRRACDVMGRAEVLRVRLHAVASNLPQTAWPSWADDVPPRPGLVLVVARVPGEDVDPYVRIVLHLPPQHDGLWDIHSDWIQLARGGKTARKRHR